MSSADRPHDLQLEPEQMRRLGYRVVDTIVEHLSALPEESATRTASRSEMERLFREPPPEAPTDPVAVLDRVRDDVFSHVMYLNHPRFFGWVPGPTNFVSAMAEALTATFNPFMGSWLVSPAPATIELVTVDWLRQMIGLPEGAGGLFVSGGSMANLTALAVAREDRLHGDGSGGVIYVSSQTHSSVERALRVLGFAPDQMRQIPADASFRLVPEQVRAAIDADRAAGRRPFCVVASAGTTNTGAVDPLTELAAVCREKELWFHVDGAYGAPAMLTERARPLFAGIEQADSVTLDPHKWLFQPYEIGCVLVRRRDLLPRAFSIFRDYMRDAIGDDDQVNFRDYGVQLTRSFRALKLWMSIQTFGLGAFRSAIAHGLELAELAEAEMNDRGGWEVVTPAQLGLITFRRVPSSIGGDHAEQDRLTQALGRRMYEDGHAVISSTAVRGRPVLRLCTINPRTSPDDVRTTLDKFETFASELGFNDD